MSFHIPLLLEAVIFGALIARESDKRGVAFTDYNSIHMIHIFSKWMNEFNDALHIFERFLFLLIRIFYEEINHRYFRLYSMYLKCL